MHARVVLRETLVEVFDLDVPRIDRAVDERRVGTVAVGIAVDDRRLVDELAHALELLDDVLVALLAEASLVLGNRIRERAGVVERIDECGHAGFLADAEVVFTVGRGDMDDAHAVVGRHVVVVEDLERTLGGLVGEVREDRLVGRALQLRALELGDDLILLGLLEDRGKTELRHDVDGLRLVRHVANRDIVDVRARAHREVLGQRPRRRRPHEEIDNRAFGQRTGDKRRETRALGEGHDRRSHRHRRVLDILVVRTRLEVGERRRELPTVRHDAVRLVDAALVPELLEDPPDRLHELGLHRLVVVVEVDPATHARHRLAPLGDVLQHHRTALLVEFVDAELLDLGRAGDAEGVLRKGFDREPVRIPAEATFHVLAAHRLVTRDDVLNRTGEKMAVVRQAGGKGRTVVKLIALLALVLLQRLLERRILFPEREDTLFHRREGHLI